MKTTNYDIIGIGLGPFNLSLAALLEPTAAKRRTETLFLEKKKEFDWHGGMILPGTTLQVPFLADLVTMVDPTNPYSFLNFLKEKNRLYNFYFLEEFKIFRKEYNQYCRWAANRLTSTQFGHDVQDIKIDESGYRVSYQDLSGAQHDYLARNLVLGYGTTPFVPDFARPFLGERVFHTAGFAHRPGTLADPGRVVVVGSGQSAAECFLELGQSGLSGSLSWFTRGEGFLPMEYSKLGLEHFAPEYIDYFYQLPEGRRDHIRSGQDLWYKGISGDTIGQIYNMIYERRLESESRGFNLAACSECTGLKQRTDGSYELTFRHTVQEKEFSIIADTIVFGTGYQYRIPKFLDSLLPEIETDEQGRFSITRDYRLKLRRPDLGRIYVQNGEIHSHGIGAPDLGLGAYRSSVIINSIYGEEIYPQSPKNVFQTFGAPNYGIAGTGVHSNHVAIADGPSGSAGSKSNGDNGLRKDPALHKAGQV